MFKKIIVIVILTIFILSTINAVDESQNPIYIILASLLAILPPVLSACMVFFVNANKSKVMEICVYFIGAVGLFFYTIYAVNGTTDPDTSAHMHIILFPVVYGLFSIFVLTIGIRISSFVKAKTERDSRDTVFNSVKNQPAK